MKKTTFYFILFFGLIAFGQEAISFEASEGYTTTDINGQNGWSTTATGGGNIANQVVSNLDATDGSNSLRIGTEISFSPQSAPIVGAYYNYGSAVDASSAVFSFDFKMSSLNESDYLFGLSSSGDEWITHVRFTSLGDIIVRVPDGTGTWINPSTSNLEDLYSEASVNWVANTWYNVRVEIAANDVTVFINNSEVFDGVVATPNEDIVQAAFLHDNFDSFAFIDNFRTNNEVLSTLDQELSNTFSYRYLANSKELLIESSTLVLNQLNVYNMLGQEVLTKDLSSTSERITLNNLASGMYIVQVSLNGKTESFKFSKY